MVNEIHKFFWGVQDDPKLSDDTGEVPKSNGVVGGSIPGRELVSLLDQKLVRWLSVNKRRFATYIFYRVGLYSSGLR
jgi:hypothetical protein